MAEHPLIAAQLHSFHALLPGELAEELADGLHDTYQAQLDRVGDPDAAAHAAIIEFGDARAVTRAAWRESTLRRRAVLLLASGPALGAIWAAALLGQHAWAWQLPVAARAVVGTTLILIVTMLLLTIRTERVPYLARRRTVRTIGVLVAVLDLCACAATLTYGSTQSHVVQLALAASLLRSTALATPTLRCLVTPADRQG